jgi:8-oxo-dGTP pyrophosphatase MutT (NUDIX family)
MRMNANPAFAELVQVGALPIMIAEDGDERVLLLTSRETRSWVIPKGWPMKGRKPWEAAAQEARRSRRLRQSGEASDRDV